MLETTKNIFGANDVEESMLLSNIKHGRRYLSCAYYPEEDLRYPGYIKVDVLSRETVEHVESDSPKYHERYSRYAKRELLKLSACHDHRSDHSFSWVKDPYSSF